MEPSLSAWMVTIIPRIDGSTMMFFTVPPFIAYGTSNVPESPALTSKIRDGFCPAAVV